MGRINEEEGVKGEEGIKEAGDIRGRKSLRERIGGEIASLNKMDVFSGRDQKLPWYKNVLRRLFGWYVNPVMEKQWATNQKLVVMLEEICRENQELWELVSRVGECKGRIDKLEAKLHEETEKRIKGCLEAAEGRKGLETHVEGMNGRLEHLAQNTQKLQMTQTEYMEQMEYLVQMEMAERTELTERMEQRVGDIEQREIWTRERFEGQDAKFESMRVFEEWARGQIDSHHKRLKSQEVFEEWSRGRFEEQAERMKNIADK